jgi:hypothetical protein
VVFTGQRVRWEGRKLVVDQDKAVEDLSEVNLDKHLKDDTPCTASQHTEFRSLLGSLNWLQSRTQFAVCYNFSRAASASAGPKIGDIRSLNKIVSHQSGQNPKDLSFMTSKETSPHRLSRCVLPEQCGQILTKRPGEKLLAEPKASFLRGQPPAGGGDSRGSLIEYESTKIRRTTLSTTVAELYSFMKCYGTCLFLKGL